MGPFKNIDNFCIHDSLQKMTMLEPQTKKQNKIYSFETLSITSEKCLDHLSSTAGEKY